MIFSVSKKPALMALLTVHILHCDQLSFATAGGDHLRFLTTSFGT
jgi:hypothetical protein